MTKRNVKFKKKIEWQYSGKKVKYRQKNEVMQMHHLNPNQMKPI